jgi:hypothetical protein
MIFGPTADLTLFLRRRALVEDFSFCERYLLTKEGMVLWVLQAEVD